MRLLYKSAIIVIFVNTCCAFAELTGAIEQPQGKMFKPGNGKIISWMGGKLDNWQTNQVNIFDEQGHLLAGVNVLRAVSEASHVSIYDVAERSGTIAVAAVFDSRVGNGSVRMAASLLTFDFSGHLISAFALQPTRQIFRLAIDDESNIWTLTSHADHGDPATVPMLVEYSRDGAVVREMLMRSSFPLHARAMKVGPAVGNVFMGYKSGVVWFWLPGGDFVTISAHDGQATRIRVPAPNPTARQDVLLSLGREASGDLVAEFKEGVGLAKPTLKHYRWSAEAKQWLPLGSGSCSGYRLIGEGEKGQLYLHYQGDRADICRFQ